MRGDRTKIALEGEINKLTNRRRQVGRSVFVVTNEPAERRRSAGEAAENSAT